jgi:hypothetical protein
MISFYRKVYPWLGTLTYGFNLAFVTVATVLWVALVVVSLPQNLLSWGDLWAPADTLFREISFQISCVVLLILNGKMAYLRLLFEYVDLRKKLDQTAALKKAISHKIHHKGLHRGIDKG